MGKTNEKEQKFYFACVNDFKYFMHYNFLPKAEVAEEANKVASDWLTP